MIPAGTGPVFSAGHNFGDMAGAMLAQARELFAVCTEMMDAVQAMPQPVIAKVKMASGAMTPDAQEGINAFLEKRPAQYRQLPSSPVA